MGTEDFEPLRKRPPSSELRGSSSWDDIRRSLTSLSGQSLNIAHGAVDRHVFMGRGSNQAIVHLDADGNREVISYRTLYDMSNRFANVLRTFGVRKGESVFVLTRPTTELYTTALGTWKNASVFCCLAPSLDPETIARRIALADGRLLVVDEQLYEEKIDPVIRRLPAGMKLLLISDEPAPDPRPHFRECIEQASPQLTLPLTAPEDPAFIDFVNRPGGKEQGIMHVHESVLSLITSGREALDMHPGDVYYCPRYDGWTAGIPYGIIAPLSNGVTIVVDAARPEPDRFRDVIGKEHVNIWYATPSALRDTSLTRPEGVPGQFRHLRFIASSGHPLSPDEVRRISAFYGTPVHENWWQSETGAILIGNTPGEAIRPGAMGRPLHGAEVSLVRRKADGVMEKITDPNVQGEIAIRAPWPSMFRSLLKDADGYSERFADGYYLTGESAQTDKDGYFWFQSAPEQTKASF